MDFCPFRGPDAPFSTEENLTIREWRSEKSKTRSVAGPPLFPFEESGDAGRVKWVSGTPGYRQLTREPISSSPETVALPPSISSSTISLKAGHTRFRSRFSTIQDSKATELGTDSTTSVPAAARLQTLSLAPTLSARLRIPGSPKSPSRFACST